MASIRKRKRPEEVRAFLTALWQAAERPGFFGGRSPERDRALYMALLSKAWELARLDLWVSDRKLSQWSGLGRSSIRLARRSLERQHLVTWRGQPNRGLSDSTLWLLTRHIGAGPPPWAALQNGPANGPGSEPPSGAGMVHRVGHVKGFPLYKSKTPTPKPQEPKGSSGNPIQGSSRVRPLHDSAPANRPEGGNGSHASEPPGLAPTCVVCAGQNPAGFGPRCPDHLTEEATK